MPPLQEQSPVKTKPRIKIQLPDSRPQTPILNPQTPTRPVNHHRNANHHSNFNSPVPTSRINFEDSPKVLILPTKKDHATSVTAHSNCLNSQLAHNNFPHFTENQRCFSGNITSHKPVKEPLTPLSVKHDDKLAKNNIFLNSIEKGLSKMRLKIEKSGKTSMTPKRKSQTSHGDPVFESASPVSKDCKTIHNLSNISHVSYKSPGWLLKSIQEKIIERPYINYRVKRSTIRCQMINHQMSDNRDLGSNPNVFDGHEKENGHEVVSKIKLDFEIEVVRLSSEAMERARQQELHQDGPNTPDKPPICAVRRRRIKGDTFLYKNICNSLLAEIDQSQELYKR